MIDRRLAALALLCTAGCSISELGTADRMARGLVLVLPGIEGRSTWNLDVARGLDDGGVKAAIEIYVWNTPIPFAPMINLADLERNQEQAARLARRIRQYQSDYPGRPIHLVGHSAGAGIAIMALESLPKDHPVTGALLLAPAVSPHHNLYRALQRTEMGIVNCYSPLDVFFLSLGTMVLGTVDRELGPAAGAVGFARQADPVSRALYAERLYQVKWTAEMSRTGNIGGHMGWTSPAFVRDYLAPLVLQQQTRQWPSGAWDSLARKSRGDGQPIKR